MNNNVDDKVVEDFGSEWGFYNQSNKDEEFRKIYNDYFKLFPWEIIPKEACGFDMGCGSGRWAKFVAPKVKKLTCIDPSAIALKSARNNLREFTNITFECGTTESCSLKDNSQDFGYSLGVLHHIPNTKKALKDCVAKLKPEAPMLLYLYYKFENKNIIYKYIWFCSDLARKIISKLPFFLKIILTSLIATFIYFPLAKFSLLLNKLKINIKNIPLSEYRNKSYYVMLTDSLDRFGTRLEKRFSKNDIYELTNYAGLKNVKISDKAPYWNVIGYKSN